ncbi:MAG: PQQ-binding-like beta-propeller repeat protein, partial [Planctomycetaceae bacterium]|nr:PQQ-binding-like beta-propeller repeat protein [Planctomycetaceae bacterium]
MRMAVWVSAFLLATVVCGEASDWPQWRGLQRDGVAADEEIRSDWAARPPQLLWMVDGMGDGYASVAIADGVLYTTGNGPQGQQAVAVDAASGEIVWAKSLTEESPKHSYPGSRS